MASASTFILAAPRCSSSSASLWIPLSRSNRSSSCATTTASLPRVAAFVAARAGRELSPLITSMMTEPNTAPAEKDFLPGPVLLLGAPGVGKGTQAKALMAAYRIPQISTGDILRANISKGTTLGKMAKALVDQGKPVSDDLVNQMLADRLSQPDA